ncbi:uncharacterized protein (TIGR02231 family) [Orbus hercynius]|uniref:Uncharacterized protein (TIGR02231 family) n=1 Tax=Orbus hercynius TaxID=593135 RepID=A0A495RHT4_9GAMM|nr:DUF4139 domain-containing protein [Orbus hercynius]RKS87093.1 uncharacterized protein (TIGR02231 family) [Orbus hercynius]
MQLKKVIVFLFVCSIPTITLQALASESTAKVDLTKVTLYLSGAELQGTSVVKVPKGESEILLIGLAKTINPNSINVGLNNKAMILSTTLVDDYMVQKSSSDKQMALTTALKKLEDEKAVLSIKLAAVNEEIALLKGNRIDTIIKPNGSINDAKQVMGFVKENLITALTEQRAIELKQAELQKSIKQYQLQINQEDRGDNLPQKAIKVKIYSDESIELPISLSYITPEAGWEPIYDVRVKDISSPVGLTYKANVYQYSGLNWNNIDLTLSTANPSQGITAPELAPWNISLYDSKRYGVSNAKTVLYEAKQSEVNYDVLQQKNNVINYIVTDNNGLNLQFNIKLPYTITGYSNDNILVLQQRDAAAQYRYIAIPKLDNHVFLQAQITHWDTLALLPGKSTVFYAGNYVGEGYLTTQGVKDTLNISLGRDNEIIVARNQDLNETSKPSFFGNEVSQKFAYTIDVKNLKEREINMTVYDQLPVIENKTITLDDTKYSGASYDKDTGLLTWQIHLAAKETKQLPFSFKITYPKDKADNIIGL